MKIQTNTAANSALGYMKVNAQNTERSIQKLSSGFRINRASDDAAGLAIANQLRADAKTLGQAQKNSAQAGAMLQIADGAAQTIGNIFDRMRELASQGASANIGGQGAKLQDEWNALYSEADRIIQGTKYQGTNVLTGLKSTATATAAAGSASGFSGATITAAGSIPTSLANGQYQIKDSGTSGKLEIWSTGSGAALVATSSAAVTAGAGSVSFDNGMTLTKASGFTAYAAATTASSGTVTTGVITASATTFSGTPANTTQTSAQNGTYTVVSAGDGTTGTIKLQKGGVDVAGTTINKSTLSAGGTLDFGNGISMTLGASFDKTTNALDTMTITVAGASATAAATASSANTNTFDVTGATAAATASSAPVILVGTSASQGSGTYAANDSVGLDLGSLDAAAIKNLSSTRNYGAGGLATGADLTTTTGAQDALSRLDSAVGALNTFIGKLGAAESRVDYASQNVSSMLQNTQAAESSIRDADMAYEMTQFTKNNILQQAAQSMLSQANQGTQGILQLLRG